MLNFNITLDTGISLNGDMETVSMLDGQYGSFLKVFEMDTYTGETTVTPTQETQILHTANKAVLEDIVIEPIPENYGLITWNGSFIMVS